MLAAALSRKVAAFHPPALGLEGKKTSGVKVFYQCIYFTPEKKADEVHLKDLNTALQKKISFFLNCGHDVMNVSLTSLSLRPPLKHIDIQYVL